MYIYIILLLDRYIWPRLLQKHGTSPREKNDEIAEATFKHHRGKSPWQKWVMLFHHFEGSLLECRSSLEVDEAHPTETERYKLLSKCDEPPSGIR